MLTRRRLFSTLAALGAFLISPLKARAAQKVPDLEIPQNIRLPQKGEQLVFIPIAPGQPDLVNYLAGFAERFTQRMDLRDGCELTIRFHDTGDVGFGIPDKYRDIRYRNYGDLKFSNLFEAAIRAHEDLMSRKDGLIRFTFSKAPDLELVNRFLTQVTSVSIMVRPFKSQPGPNHWKGLFRTVRLRKQS